MKNRNRILKKKNKKNNGLARLKPELDLDPDPNSQDRQGLRPFIFVI